MCSRPFLVLYRVEMAVRKLENLREKIGLGKEKKICKRLHEYISDRFN